MDVWAKPITMPELIERVSALLTSAAEGDAPGIVTNVGSAALRLLAATLGLLLGGGTHVPKVH